MPWADGSASIASSCARNTEQNDVMRSCISDRSAVEREVRLLLGDVERGATADEVAVGDDGDI